MERHRPPSDGHFFVYHFLQRLPHKVRILLGDEDPADTRRLAEKADQLMALHQPQVHDVAAVAAAASSEPGDSPEATVAAAGKSGQRQQKKKWKMRRAKRGSSPAEGWQSSLCYFHVRYGDKAHRCEEPCTWPGN
jgi:hypothetical protein